MDVVWKRYEAIVEMFGDKPRPKYISRRASFKDDVTKALGDDVTFVRPWDQAKPLLIHHSALPNIAIANAFSRTEDNTDLNSILTSSPEDEFTRSLVHVMLKIRNDMKSTLGHQSWKEIDKEHVQQVVPESLLVMLHLLFQGDVALVDSDIKKRTEKQWIYSIAQDLVYGVSGGKKLTPKHIGLGMTVHQMTRSKQLIDILHAACHSISYEMVRRIDTSIASHVLEKFKDNDNVYIPECIQPGVFAHFAADNIDILEETLDGKNTFHATQMAVWQRGRIEPDHSEVLIGKEKVLNRSLVDDIHKIETVQMPVNKPLPILQGCFSCDNGQGVKQHEDSRHKDIAWLLSRIECESDQHVPGWSGFNRSLSTTVHEISSTVFLPIIQHPAHEYDTLNSVILRCLSISKKLGQKFTVITVDQALYGKLKELVWLKNKEFHTVIVRLGGLHIIMNYLQCIGKHMESSGLDDIWIESGLYSVNTTKAVLEGKSYNRALRTHKLSYEALWRVYWSSLLAWLSVRERHVGKDLLLLAKSVASAFTANERHLERETIHSLCEKLTHVTEFQEYDDSMADDPTFTFWRQYMSMIEICLDFVQAEREGNWDLHLASFQSMLPFFAQYDHFNYARWGSVYLADMSGLDKTAAEVYQEFKKGNFGVKRSADVFNQVSADHALEWLNRSCKIAGGLIGITRNDTARDKWCLTHNVKASVVLSTKALLGISDEEDNAPTRNDSLPSGLARDEHDVRLLVTHFQRFQVFGIRREHLQCITTNDVCPEETENSLLQTKQHGDRLVQDFVNSRLITQSVSLYAPIKRNKALTFATLSEITVQGTKAKVVIKANDHLFHRLIVASDAGRKINLSSVLDHELSAVPLALADLGGNLRSTPKSVLGDILVESLPQTALIPVDSLVSCVLIDASALIQRIGKPNSSKTFGDLADVLFGIVLQHFNSSVKRVDIVFDQYIEFSIKHGTRLKRTGNHQPIRKLVNSRSVLLPHNWKNFITSSDNKRDLTLFLSNEFVTRMSDIPTGCELIVTGGFEDRTKVVSSKDRDLSSLSANHEEADTRLILHAEDCRLHGYERVILECSDTDFLVLCVHFCSHLPDEVWFKKGKQYIPVHKIVLDHKIRQNVITFHAFSGCDTSSSFLGYGKTSSWKMYCKVPELLDPEDEDGLERFVCRLYGCDCTKVNEARRILFLKAKKGPEALPPTKDALHHHICRVQYQVSVWRQSLVQNQIIPDAIACKGWIKDVTGRYLQPHLFHPHVLS